MFARAANGTLTPAGTYSTGGIGSGASGFSQGSVTLSPDGGTLLVVNAGSNQVSDFAVLPGGVLGLRNVVASGGTDPISVAVNGGLAAVLNAGGTANVTGFPGRLRWPDRHRRRQPAARLAGAGADPRGRRHQPRRRARGGDPEVSDTVDTFAVGRGGTLAQAITSPSDSGLSFAEVFTPSGQLLVADDGAAGTSALSAYRIKPTGTLSATQAAVSDGQTAACWVAIAPRDGDVFVDNAGSGTVSSYQVSPFGRVTGIGRNASIGSSAKPLDDAGVLRRP